MIIDLNRFITEERPTWTALGAVLDSADRDSAWRPNLDEIKRFHYLYQRTSADLAKVAAFAAEPELRRYLESLVARAYGEVHEVRRPVRRPHLVRWFLRTFPRTFRRHLVAFNVSMAATIAGVLFGAGTVFLAPENVRRTVAFPVLRIDPARRVEWERQHADRDRLRNVKGRFASFLMTHNMRVSALTTSLGMTWGIGSLILLFYNGIILGSVMLSYVLAHQTAFVLGWLLPHGVIEIPAVLISGQAGFLLAAAMIGRRRQAILRERLRAVGADVVTLIGGVAVMLVWAGFVEAFFSQYHEPIIPYWVKIAFGVFELLLLVSFLSLAGRRAPPPGRDADEQ